MIVADGGRRYARRIGVSKKESYFKAAVKGEDVAKLILIKNKIPELTIFAVSYANITKRKSEELESLMKAVTKFMEDLLKDDQFIKGRIKVTIYGHRELIPKYCKEAITRIENKTRKFDKGRLNLLIAYSGMLDFENAIRKTQNKGKDLNFKNILEQCSLKTPIDLFIRTGNGRRISDGPFYLLLYSEMYFIIPYVPEVNKSDITNVIISYKRKRGTTFGV
jgi:undecaprenyl diphosphate synthase